MFFSRGYSHFKNKKLSKNVRDFLKKGKMSSGQNVAKCLYELDILDASGSALCSFFLPVIYKLLGRQKTTNEEVPVSMQKNLKLKLFS